MKSPSESPVCFSIVIPCLNGGGLLRDCIARCLAQDCPRGFELVVIDSGSTDGSAEFLAEIAAREPRLRLHHIERSQFGHGKTRNLGARLSRGEYICFITQDALPQGERWLAAYEEAFRSFPDAIGAFGRHVAHPWHGAYAAHCMDAHFANFGEKVQLRRIESLQRYETDTAHRQWLHFYSDNNSCMKKDAWLRLPYPEVSFGEDQLWADLALRAGESLLYVPNAVVSHSHDFRPRETRDRAAEETAFFLRHFGYVRRRSLVSAVRAGWMAARRERRFWHTRRVRQPAGFHLRRLAVHLLQAMGELKGSRY